MTRGTFSETGFPGPHRDLTGTCRSVPCLGLLYVQGARTHGTVRAYVQGAGCMYGHGTITVRALPYMKGVRAHMIPYMPFMHVRSCTCTDGTFCTVRARRVGRTRHACHMVWLESRPSGKACC